MGVLGGANLRYTDVLNGVARFIQRRRLNDVCIMEFEQGVIITGSALYETGESYNRYTETHVLSIDDLQRIMKEA